MVNIYVYRHLCITVLKLFDMYFNHPKNKWCNMFMNSSDDDIG